jgi:hypothetical protein
MDPKIKKEQKILSKIKSRLEKFTPPATKNEMKYGK